MRRAVFYLRVSTIDQTTANQERELRAIPERMSCEVYKDHGISGAKGPDFQRGRGRAATFGGEVGNCGSFSPDRPRDGSCSRMR